jgi:hypothetical protein
VVVTRVHYNSPGMHKQTTALIEDHVLAALRSAGARDAPAAAPASGGSMVVPWSPPIP